MLTSTFIPSEKKSRLLSYEGIFGFVTVGIICVTLFLQTSCSGGDIHAWKYNYGKDEWDRLKAVPESVDRRMSFRRHSLQLLSKDSASEILFVAKRPSNPRSYRIWTSTRDSIELLDQFSEPVDRTNCILSDSQGRFILGTSHGILMIKGEAWTAFTFASVLESSCSS